MRQAPTGRERTEDLERASLSTWATLAAETKGRDRYEEPDLLRTVFQDDRDRILGCQAFRGLADQAHMLVRDGDRYRSRLAHTLEVAQLARTIACGLRLNEDLAESVALGHALGYGPFAGACEEALALLEAFRPDDQAVRVVERLANGGDGLNLTWEVRDGIAAHAGPMPPATPEGQAARAAGVIARLTYDVEAAVRAGLLGFEDIPAEVIAVAGATRRDQTTAMLADIVATSTDRPDLAFSDRMIDAQRSVAAVMETRVHRRTSAAVEHDRGVHCLRSLAVFHLEHPSSLHGVPATDPVEVQVVDFITGLGDERAVDLFARLFLPSVRPHDG